MSDSPIPQPSSAASSDSPAPQPSTAASSGLPNNVASILCYIIAPIVGIVFLVVEPFKTIPFVRFHAIQSIGLCVVGIVTMIGLSIFGIVGTILHIGLLTSLISFLLWPLIMIGLFILWLVAVIKAWNNQCYKLPIIGQYAEKMSRVG
ncbi:MAG: hypothetical protein FWD64_02020 [Acidobacteriaceae bacterium]|nr:hypothetical protein [Acidobacteriaceae bacterium]